ncbi:anaerobic ribonucleoside-triphosphate reductase activating protein [Candidatus Falkowbacteria bacterium]|nr:anaerobic ribonucleoside-triphosphate reductase activating protein [Candidatus Falkowbacteria bacterium]
MLIGGVQPLTLLDYPGKVAMTIFTKGCGFRCRFCYNPELVIPEQYAKSISENDIWDLIKARQHLIDAVCLTGGEPTLQKDLLNFIKKLKARGLLVKLDTNGTNPDAIEQLLTEKMVDYFAMDIKAPWKKYAQVVGNAVDMAKVKKSAIIILNSGVEHEFRATVLAALHCSNDIVEMARQVKGANKFFIQRFKRVDKIIDPTLLNTPRLTLKELNDIKTQIKGWFKICGIR